MKAGLLAPVSSRFCKYWLPLLLWMALIFSASTEAGRPRVSSWILWPLLHWIDPGISDQNFELIHVCVRKMAHFTEYAALGFLALRVARVEPRLAQKGAAWPVGAALLFSALYASSDEFHQSFVPGRQPAVTDVMIDSAGAAAGLAVTVAVQRLRRAK